MPWVRLIMISPCNDHSLISDYKRMLRLKPKGKGQVWSELYLYVLYLNEDRELARND